MDEVVFRTSRSFENFQVQVLIATEHGKVLLRQCSEYVRNALVHVRDSSLAVRVYDFAKGEWIHLWNFIGRIKHYVVVRLNFSYIIDFIKQNCIKPNIYIGCVGFIIGSLLGFGIGLAMQRQQTMVRCVQAVQCLRYTGIESVAVVEDAIAACKCGEDDVLVSVKAASVHIIDAQICNGYGRKLRCLLNRYNHCSKNDLPVTLGRDCTGIVIDIGGNVRRLEIGDEVWLTVPFWASGTLSQTILVPQSLVSHKPRATGFEAACSLPYAGTIALNILKTANLDEGNCEDKRILIQEGCTPVGCILIQLLSSWNAHVTTTCFKRAEPVARALGARDVIPLPEDEHETSSTLHTNNNNVTKFYVKELELRNKFDVVIITKDYGVRAEDFRLFCNKNDCVYSTLPPVVYSDSFGAILSCFLWIYIRSRSFLQRTFYGKEGIDFEETHMCYLSLNYLKELVEKNRLQTVVDKVYHLSDIELALNHIQSSRSIGSTVISFR